MIILNILGLVVAATIMVLSGTLIIRALTKIASYLKLSDFVVGFIIMAFATSSPELFVGITSVINDVPSLSLGDILGSNIVDITLVLGLVTILARGIKVQGKIILRDTYLAVFIAILPLLLMLDRNLSRVDGAILVLSFIFYITWLWRQRKRFKKFSDSISKRQFLNSIFLFIIGVALLLISANFIVSFSTSLAINFGLPLILIGIVVVAIGTDLPELVFEIKAVRSKREGMALGDALGSVVTQGTFVLGIVGILSPFTIENYKLFIVSAIFLIAALILFTCLVRTKKALSWKEGIVLIMFYILFLIVELSI
jgi:cation:H+ antiporter